MVGHFKLLPKIEVVTLPNRITVIYNYSNNLRQIFQNITTFLFIDTDRRILPTKILPTLI